jgi:hypothetical protein
MGSLVLEDTENRRYVPAYICCKHPGNVYLLLVEVLVSLQQTDLLTLQTDWEELRGALVLLALPVH